MPDLTSTTNHSSQDVPEVPEPYSSWVNHFVTRQEAADHPTINVDWLKDDVRHRARYTKDESDIPVALICTGSSKINTSQAPICFITLEGKLDLRKSNGWTAVVKANGSDGRVIRSRDPNSATFVHTDGLLASLERLDQLVFHISKDVKYGV